MKSAQFRFYAELNDFLPPSRRGMQFSRAFVGSPSVKDAIESLGVPHSEVDLVLVDGESVDFRFPLRDGARVSVYPVFESIDISPIARVRPSPLREPRFVLDVHLGRLAAYLRMLGFDVFAPTDCADAGLARISAEQRRILLTRDRNLLKRSAVTHGYWIRERVPRLQLVEVLKRFDLFQSVSPFRRCLRCNSLLEPIEKATIGERLPPRIRESHGDFRICRSCDRIYWKGSHHQRMQRLIQLVTNNPNSVSPGPLAHQANPAWNDGNGNFTLR